jgi:predicted GIY-YIG superfamily endonuclease
MAAFPHHRSRLGDTVDIVVDNIQDATAPQMLWGKKRKAKKTRPTPISLPQFVYLFECSFDSSIVIAGITYDLKSRSTAPGYGRLLWSQQLRSRQATAAAERRFMRITARHAIGIEYRGRLTWTEGRRMSAAAAIAAWQQAIGSQH